MAKKVQPLTDTEIKQAKPKEKEYNLGDGDGLSLKIKPIGTKLWRFSYYHPVSRKRLNISFGKYPNLSLAKARTKADAEAEKLEEGEGKSKCPFTFTKMNEIMKFLCPMYFGSQMTKLFIAIGNVLDNIRPGMIELEMVSYLVVICIVVGIMTLFVPLADSKTGTIILPPANANMLAKREFEIYALKYTVLWNFLNLMRK